MLFKLNISSYPPQTEPINPFLTKRVHSLRRTSRVAPEAFVNAEGACTKAPCETRCPRVSHNSGSFVLLDDFRALRAKNQNAVFFRIVLELQYKVFLQLLTITGKIDLSKC